MQAVTFVLCCTLMCQLSFSRVWPLHIGVMSVAQVYLYNSVASQLDRLVRHHHKPLAILKRRFPLRGKRSSSCKNNGQTSQSMSTHKPTVPSRAVVNRTRALILIFHIHTHIIKKILLLLPF